MTLLDARLILDSPQLRRARKQIPLRLSFAETSVLGGVARDYEQKLERLTSAASGSEKLGRAWKSEVRKREGRRPAAGLIYVNGGARARGAIEYLTESGRVAGRGRAGFLAIPLPAAGAKFVGSGRNKKTITPRVWEIMHGQKLRLVSRGEGKFPLLVAEYGTTSARTGRFRPITRKRTLADERRGFVRGAQTIPIFVLIPPRSFSGRFSITGALAGMDEELERRFVRALARLNGESLPGDDD